MSKHALVVGGTGPTGPDIVNGLLQRGYRTTIFHSGRHEVPLPEEVEHIHGDAHFPESISEALGTREFDVVIAQYGRLRHLVDHFDGRTGHVIAIGGMNGPLADPTDSRWGGMGKPAVIREQNRVLIEQVGEGNKLGFKIAEASRHLFAAREAGAFRATYLVYPVLYGPRQPGCSEWHVVRRILDGRSRLVLPDGGLRLESRGFTRNVAQAPLAVLDHPQVADGKTYPVADLDLFTTRQRVEAIARHMGAELEIVELPYELASPAYPFYRHGRDHRVGLAELIREELGYTDAYATADAIGHTVDWLLSATDTRAEIENQLGDPFDYEFEDQLIEWSRTYVTEAPQPAVGAYTYNHIYRHPKGVGEDWKPRT